MVLGIDIIIKGFDLLEGQQRIERNSLLFPFRENVLAVCFFTFLLQFFAIKIPDVNLFCFYFLLLDLFFMFIYVYLYLYIKCFLFSFLHFFFSFLFVL